MGSLSQILRGDAAAFEFINGIHQPIQKFRLGFHSGISLQAAAELTGNSCHGNDPATVIDLAGAGWKDELFVKPGAKASYALEYAMILHIFGRNDLALQLAEIACEDAAKLPKLLEKARTARTYYRKINDISAGIKVPDLKK